MSLVQLRNYRTAVDFCRGDSRASRFLLPTDIDESISDNRINITMAEHSKCLQLMVACIFCDYEFAWKMSEELDKFHQYFSGSILPYICAFYRGLAAISMLNMTKSTQCSGTVKSCLKQLRKGRKVSPTNLSHHSYLLEEEYAAFRKKYTQAEKFYLMATEKAELAGAIHEQALACERFGAYHLLRENHDATYEQIIAAHRLYMKWGARPKCEMLKNKYPRLGERAVINVRMHSI